jgi:hypothetical protein
VLLTFHFVCAAWIFFRAPTFRAATSMFAQLGTFTTFHPNLPPAVLAVLGVGLLSHFVPERAFAAARDSFLRLPAPVQGMALFGAAVVVRRMDSAETVPFVYFQF